MQKVYVVPYRGFCEGELLFELPYWRGLRDRLRAVDIDLIVVDFKTLPSYGDLILIHCDAIEAEELACLAPYPRKKRILSIWEPPAVDRNLHASRLHRHFGKVVTWKNFRWRRRRYLKHYLPHSLQSIPDGISFEEKNLLTTVVGNKSSTYRNELYSYRLADITQFDQINDGQFTFYGRGWDGAGFATYGGSVQDKAASLQNFRFCLSYENCRTPGYMTEKIFDCFVAGCVPIYAGDPQVERVIPKECFISRDEFSSPIELYQFLQSINRVKWKKYIDAAKAYLQTEDAKKFSHENFIDIYSSCIRDQLSHTKG